MKNKCIYFFIVVIAIAFCGNVKAQVLTQNFEGNAWTPTAYVVGTTAGANTTIPSGAPVNIPASQSWYGNGNGNANDVWHRSDYGTGWTTPGSNTCGGSNPPPSCGANGTGHSLLFDGFDAPNGSNGYVYSPIMDLSGSCAASVTFYYFNYDNVSSFLYSFPQVNILEEKYSCSVNALVFISCSQLLE